MPESRGKTGSVARELIHALDDPAILWKCRIFEETGEGITAIETLLKEELSARRYAVTLVERGDDADLYEHVSSDVFQFFFCNFETGAVKKFSVEGYHEI